MSECAVDLLWEYINTVKTMEETPGLYMMDDMRAKTHVELVRMLLPLFREDKRETLKSIIDEHLHGMDKYNYNADRILKSIKAKLNREVTK